eukprot:TRINITY_DN52467_c0_g1_i1.p1 TRINITY_DN52467_c0_g1~~TRINITY_DN52467_c0_g1_i1.p1  ORF type:complete len:318 (-),score=33.29 TRINITY_DN52467_c0_g1_i1:48-1001(-)
MQVHPEADCKSVDDGSCDREIVSSKAPAKSSWREYYTNDELVFWRRLLMKDLLGTPVAVAWYFVIAAFVRLLGVVFRQVEFEDDGERDAPPAAVLVLHAVMVIVAFVVCVVNSLGELPPNSEDGVYTAMRVLGQWIFLTRHCLALQFMHVACSFVAAALHWWFLEILVSGMTLLIGALGCFVTIQYFTLCHFHPDFVKKRAQMMSRTPPHDSGRVQVIVHVPALPLALLDLVIAKNREIVRSQCSILATVVITLFYVLFYLFLILANFSATKRWPYPVLKSLSRLYHWVFFVVAQVGVVTVFVTTLWALMKSPALWD